MLGGVSWNGIGRACGVWGWGWWTLELVLEPFINLKG
jgi:hypothetical protein